MPRLHRLKCFVKPSPKGARYAAGALDFIAAYILPEDIWYIIPFTNLTSKNTVHLDPRSTRNRYRPYVEAWHLLLGEPLSKPAALVQE